MKVLFLVNIPSPYRIEFFNELGKNCDLTVAFEQKRSKERNEKWYIDNFENFKTIFLSSLNLGNKRVLGIGIIKEIISSKYDVIVVGGYSTPTGILAILLMKLIKKKFFLNADGGMIGKDSKLKGILKRNLIGRANYYLSTGKQCNEYLKYYGADEKNIFIYPFTTLKEKEILNRNLTVDEKQKIRNELEIGEKKVILSIGQFIYRKGFDVLIKACKDLDEEYGVYIIGGQPTKEYLEIIDKYKIKNIKFIDFKVKEEILKYYMASDIFVFPTREDIWGLVINEAMAYGLPIITTDKCVAGVELIECGKNGYIIPINNSDLISSRVKTLYDNFSLINNMQLNNIKKSKEYTLENMAKVHIKIFEQYLSGQI